MAPTKRQRLAAAARLRYLSSAGSVAATQATQETTISGVAIKNIAGNAMRYGAAPIQFAENEWYASPSGTPGGAGTIGDPWDLPTALDSANAVEPGDTIYLRGGTYYFSDRAAKFGYEYDLKGMAAAPIIIRGYQDEQATIDGGLESKGAEYVTWMNIEVIVSENLSGEVVTYAADVWGLTGHPYTTTSRLRLETTGSLPTGYSPDVWYWVINPNANDFQLSETENGAAVGGSGGSGTHSAVTRVTVAPGSAAYRDELSRPSGGFDVSSGTAISIVNCVVHANRQGIGHWGQIYGESVIYGNLIYDNGWNGPDRNHGHGLYTQNQVGSRKIVSNNIFLDGWALSGQAYGSDLSYVDRFTVTRNIYNKGGPSDDGLLLVGGQRESDDIIVNENVGHLAPCKIGWKNGNTNGTAHDNYIREDFQLNLDRWPTPEASGTEMDNNNNFEYRPNAATAKLDDVEVPIPTGDRVFIFNNSYDSNRANLAIYNYDLNATVDVNFSTFLSNGETFELRDPKNFYGAAVMSDTWLGTPLAVTMDNDEFKAFVIMRT